MEPRKWTACVGLPWGMWFLSWHGPLGQVRVCQASLLAGVPCNCREFAGPGPCPPLWEVIYRDVSEWASLVVWLVSWLPLGKPQTEINHQMVTRRSPGEGTSDARVAGLSLKVLKLGPGPVSPAPAFWPRACLHFPQG